MVQWLGLSTFIVSVRSLVGEMRSFKLYNGAKKKKNVQDLGVK